jgi:hypothetical protein|nr:MAG TPA: hypothetical protein [Caudoviricetes sp.]
MAKLILKDKTEIDVISHYGTTFVVQVDKFAKLDIIIPKFTEENTKLITIKNDDGTVNVLTDLILDFFNTVIARDNHGEVVSAVVSIALKEVDKIAKLESRLNTLSDAMATDMDNEEAKNEQN